MVKEIGATTIKNHKINVKTRLKRKRQNSNQNNDLMNIKKAKDQVDLYENPRIKSNNSNDMGTVNEDPIVVEKKQKRYILFVGNLPYGITKKQITTFFKALDVISVRLLESKIDKKPQGCAFVEFKSPKDFTAALKYHRQMLDGRCIRVERTVGGGGKGKSRQQKLKQVNRKLRKSRKSTWEKVLKKKEMSPN